MSGTVERSRRPRSFVSAEARNLLSENAASVGRLAAALSHELNSPIGALVSGVDTLLLAGCPSAALCHRPSSSVLSFLQNELRKSIQAVD